MADVEAFIQPQHPKASAEEIALALKDVACRDSSGYARAYYDVHWAMLDAYVKANQNDCEGESKRP